jgi:uncharacterized membrane protein YkvA (DUF1232 family)
MLNSFKKDLLQLSKSSNEKLISKIKRQLKLEETEQATKSLTNFIVSMPDLLNEIRLSYASDQVSHESKKLYGFLLTYLYHPNDFISELDCGLLGYLDDVYFVGLTYKNYPPTKSNFSIQQIDEWLELTRKVIPNVTKKIDELFDELLKGNEQAFNEVMILAG